MKNVGFYIESNFMMAALGITPNELARMVAALGITPNELARLTMLDDARG